MSMNLSTIAFNLSKLANSISSIPDKLLLAKTISAINAGKVTCVGDVSLLPAATSVPNGSLYFIESEGRIYVATHLVKAWKPIISDYYGAVWSWGYNAFGQLGNNTSVSKLSPVSVVGGFTDWCNVSTQNARIGAVRSNGTVWMWGSNIFGDLGDNTTVSRSSPVSVVGGFTDWCRLSVGSTSALALRANGTIWAWGQNGSGQLGDGTIVNKSSPVSVVGGITNWCQVSAGGGHNAAIRTNGTVWTWGAALCGGLGDNTLVNKSSPVSVVGGFTDWCQVSAGSYSTAAVRSNGTLWTWGRNTVGRLGDNTTINKSSPVSVIGGFTDWCQVSVGSYTMFAVRSNGTLWSWGSGSCGVLGDNTTTNKSSPVSVVGGFTDWCQVSGGSSHAIAARTNGTIWTWGCNGDGRLGDGTIVDKSSPVSVVGGFANWTDVSAGNINSVGLIRKTF